MTRDELLGRIAKNLREFGYPDARPDNVLTVPILAAFSRNMLRDNLGGSEDELIEALLAEIPAGIPQ